MKKLLTLILFPFLALGQGTPTVRYNTVADMVAANIPIQPSKLSALVTGRVTANDGGGGVFFYDSTSTTATNLGTIFKPSLTTGRWIRQYSGALNVVWFGADTNNVFDSTVPIQAALNLASTGDSLSTSRGVGVFIPRGTFLVTNVITLKAGVSVYGESRESTIIRNTGTTNDIFFFSSANVSQTQHIDVSRMSLYQPGVATAGSAIHITNSVGSAYSSVRLDDLYIYAAYTGVDIANNLVGHIQDCTVQNAVSKGYITRDSTTTLTIRNCYAAGCGDDGFYVTGFYSSLIGCAADSNAGSGYHLYYGGASIQPTSITVASCGAEQNTLDGITVDNPNGVTITGSTIIGKAGSRDAIRLDGGQQVEVNNIYTVPNGATLGYGLNNRNVLTGSYTADVLVVNSSFNSFGVSAFSPGGLSQTVYINQNMGLGTATPVDLFEAVGGIHTSGAAATSKAAEMWLDYAGGNTGRIHALGPNAGTNALFEIQTQRSDGTNPKYLISSDTSGNVAIGNSTPALGSGLLQLYGGLTLNSSQIVQATGVLTVQPTGSLLLSTTDSTVGIGVTPLAGNTALQIGPSAPAAPGGITIRKDQAAYTQIVIDNQGTVAAGTGQALIFAEGNSQTLAIRGERDGSGGMSIIQGNGGALNIMTGASVAAATTKWQFLTGGNFTGTGDAVLSVAGKGVQIKEGSNARMGTAVLNGGTPATVVVNNTSVTASTRIFLTAQTDGGVASTPAVSARTAATSFTITSVAGDTNTVAWLLIEPSP